MVECQHRVRLAAAEVGQQLLLLALDLCGLVSSRDGREQTLYAIESAVGVIGTEGLLMGPLVAHVAQLTHERTLCLTEDVAEYDVPLIPHDQQQRLGVPV